MAELYTIGHSNHGMERFVDLLTSYGVEYLVDVRSVPYSKYSEFFDRDYLSDTLRTQDIRYLYMGNSLGARPADPSLYGEGGYLDFERVRASENFRQGIERIMSGLGKGFCIVLMCTEKDPFDCHRAILLARAFERMGIQAKHILSDGTIQTQKALNERLLWHYFPNRDQTNLFDEKCYSVSEQEYLCEAYRRRNRDIGHIQAKRGPKEM